MAIYAIDILAISNDEPTLTRIKNKIPARLDAKMWDAEYQVQDIIDIVSGAPAVNIQVRFNLAADRTAALNEINALSDLKPNLLVGSFIGKHKCYHDEGLPCSPLVKLWEKS